MKIGFIGGGNMAEAIIGGITKGEYCQNNEVMVYDVSEQRKEFFCKRGYSIAEKIEDILKCQYLVLSVKPQIMPIVLADLRGHIDEKKVIISIAAGISATYIKKMVEFDAKIVLVMPNTPLLIGSGMSALSKVSPTTDKEFEYVKGIFSCAGEVAEISPSMMNEVIPINGSSPAFIYYLAQLVIEKSVKIGFSEQTAKELFCHTLIGSAKMLLHTEKSPAELIKMVCSPGGTTLKAMEVFYESDYSTIISEAMEKCIMRAYELQHE